MPQRKTFEDWSLPNLKLAGTTMRSKFRDQVLVCIDFVGPRRDPCPDFPNLISRLSRLKLSARLCNWGLNPDAARPFARRMSRLSRLKLAVRLCNLDLNLDAPRPLARPMSRLSKPYIQTFQTQTLGATMQFGSESGCGATMAGMARLLRPRRRRRGFPDQDRDGATFQTKAGSTHISRQSRTRCDFPDEGGDTATNKQFLGTGWIRRDFP